MAKFSRSSSTETGPRGDGSWTLSPLSVWVMAAPSATQLFSFPPPSSSNCLLLIARASSSPFTYTSCPSLTSPAGSSRFLAFSHSMSGCFGVALTGGGLVAAPQTDASGVCGAAAADRCEGDYLHFTNLALRSTSWWSAAAPPCQIKLNSWIMKCFKHFHSLSTNG